MRIAKSMCVLLLAAGCGGGGSKISPSISGVTPTEAFLGRTTQLLVSGNGTKWRAANPPEVVIDGAGVTISNVTVASPTALLADVTVASSAAPGLRVLRVDGLAFEAFEIAPPAWVTDVLGNEAQGSIFVLRVENRDPLHPFDDSTGPFGEQNGIFFETSLPGTGASIVDVTPMWMELLVFADVTASTTSASTLTIYSGAGANTDSFTIPGAFTLAPRTPMPFTGGTAGGTISVPFESELYAITATDTIPHFVALDVTATDPDAGPIVVVLGPSGSFADYFLVGDSVGTLLEPSTVQYVLYYNQSPISPYDYTITKTDYATVEIDETEANDTSGTANVIAMNAVTAGLAHATFASGTDVDWYRVPITVGRRLHVMTMPGDPDTDTVVAVFRADGTTALGPESQDNGFHENHYSTTAPASENVFVRVRVSDLGSSGSAYQLVITSEMP